MNWSDWQELIRRGGMKSDETNQSSWKKGNTAISRFEIGDEKFFYRGQSDLESLATHFIRRTYLENLHELPRMQEIPASEFLMDCASPIFISHPWEHPYHPANETLEAIRSFVPNNDNAGLWIDYCCLPQKRRDGTDDRTEREKHFFKTQLQYIPTILLKSQVVVLWNTQHHNRAWCMVELILADIFKNMVMKQMYHCKDRLSEALLFITQTYNPMQLCVVGGVSGTPVVKILLPHSIKDLPADFYNFLLNDLGLRPTLLTTLLGRVGSEQIDRFFAERDLQCTNPHDINVLKELLLTVCKFAGQYDVSSIKWSGRIHWEEVLPYIMANMSDFSVNLVDYRF